MIVVANKDERIVGNGRVVFAIVHFYIDKAQLAGLANSNAEAKTQDEDPGEMTLLYFGTI